MKTHAFKLLAGLLMLASTVQAQDANEVDRSYNVVDANGKPSGAIARYRGEMVNGKREGRGIYTEEKEGETTYTYTGEWKNGMRHGLATVSWGDGHSYQGYYANDLRSGRGKEQYKSGTTYEGEYAEGKRNGMGIVQYDDGETIEGHWVNGQLDGFGIQTTTSGNVHAVYFAKNKVILRSQDLSQALGRAGGCNGKNPAWILVSGECTREGARALNGEGPSFINRETLDFYQYDAKNHRGTLTVYRQGLQLEGQVDAPFSFSRGEIIQVSLAEDGKSSRADRVYSGPIKGMVPDGRGSCNDGSGAMVNCTMRQGVRVK